MTRITKVIVAGAGLLVAVGVGASGASARIVCGGESGVCWHVQESYDYPATAGVIVHPDDWMWGSNANYRWQEHDGRGYWHGDQWMPF